MTRTSAIPTPQTEIIDDKETRRNISYCLLGLLSAVIVAAFAAFFMINFGDAASAVAFDQLTAVLNIVFGPVIALVSSVVGFYFGARTATEAKVGG